MKAKLVLCDEFIGPAAVTIAASAAFVQSPGRMLIDDCNDGARAAPAFRFATHVPENRTDRRTVGARADAVAHVAVGENVAGTDDHRFASLERLQTTFDISSLSRFPVFASGMICKISNKSTPLDNENAKSVPARASLKYPSPKFEQCI